MSKRFLSLSLCAALTGLALAWFIAKADKDGNHPTISKNMPPIKASALRPLEPQTKQDLTPADQTRLRDAKNVGLDSKTFPANKPSLPPIDLPLSQTLVTLKAMLASGNGLAGCQLVAQLKYCRDNLSQQKETLQGHKMTLRETKERDERYKFLADHIEFQAKNIGRAEEYCANIPQSELNSVSQYSLAAAQTGNVSAMRDYVMQLPSDTKNFLNELDAWQRYKEWAPQMAERAMAAGDVSTIGFIRLQLAGRWLASPPIVQKDTQRSAILYFLLEQTETRYKLGDHELKFISDELGPKELDDARKSAAILYQQTFAASIARGEKPSYKTNPDCGAEKLQLKMWGIG
jgi:hypothetical protein